MGFEVDKAAIERAVVAEISDRLIDENDFYHMVQDRLSKKIDRLFAEHAEKALTSAIDSAVEDGFNRTYQAVDSFGHPTGDPTSIRERLASITDSYWSARVDKRGELTKNSHNTMSRAEYVMIQACGKDFGDAIKQQAVNVTAELKDSLRAEMKAWIDRMLNDLFHVKSADDQKRK